MRADQIGPYASHMLNSTRLLLPDILWQSMHSLKCNRRTSLGQTLELFDAKQPLQIADQGCFHVSGHYVNSVNSVNGADGRLMVGQMFVQYQIPARQTQPYPVVMMHGGGQTGVNFLGTPDGRRGWADYFVANGYAVYVVDQPGRDPAADLDLAGPSRHDLKDLVLHVHRPRIEPRRKERRLAGRQRDRLRRTFPRQ